MRTHQSQAVRKQFFFLCCGNQILVLHSDKITCKSRHHVICGLALGGE